jgi:hypothetical protein
VPPKALACPECGSDKETGWASDERRNEAAYGAFTDEDYREVVRDLPGGESGPVDIRRIVFAIVALIVLIAFIVRFVV